MAVKPRYELFNNDQLPNSGGGIDFSRPLCLGYAGFNDELLRKYMNDSAYLYEGHEEALKIAKVGAAIGTYSGPGAIALAFFAKEGRQ